MVHEVIGAAARGGLAAILTGYISLIVAPAGRAATYDEAVHGDLSNDRNSPTQLLLSTGVNSVTATSATDIEVDLEYLRVDLPAGHQIDQLVMRSYVFTDDGLSFIGLQEGATWTFSPDEAFLNLAAMLGHAHFGPFAGNVDGDDLLPLIADGFGAQGFPAPLTGPSYTFWIQQTGTEVTYQLDFLVSAVPEPAALGTLGLTGVALAIARRGRCWTRH